MARYLLHICGGNFNAINQFTLQRLQLQKLRAVNLRTTASLTLPDPERETGTHMSMLLTARISKQ